MSVIIEYFFRYNNLVYLPIPKAASTSIKYIFVKNSVTNEVFENYKDDIWNIPDEYKKNNLIHPLGFEKQKNDFLFTFVKHPYDRFISFYKNKTKNRCFKDTELRLMGIDYKTNIFEVLNILEDAFKKNKLIDHHLIPQNKIIDDNYNIDFIGKTENFKEDWKVVERNHGKLITIDKLNKTKHISLLNKEEKYIRKKIYELYYNDYKKFNYEE